MATVTTASTQWANRPSDQRFTSLPELMAKVSFEKERSRATILTTRQIECAPADDDQLRGMKLIGPNGEASPNHWSFGQLAGLAKAPAKYLRTLPAPIAADAMNYGLKFSRDVEEVGLLLTKTNGHVDLRAATGPRYGRIWNSDIVQALMDRFGDGVEGDFRVPGEFGVKVDVTKENTTIYGSDRDIFVFLADEVNRIEMPNRRAGLNGSSSLARGFFVWNSEVGSESVGGAFFMFDYACKNRIVWGAEGFSEIRLRHTATAPDRWLEEIAPVLVAYAQSSAAPIEAQIKAAQAQRVDDDLDAFLRKRFAPGQVQAIKAAHEREENRPIETLWDAVTGITAFAKTIEHQDSRVFIEREAGKVLDLAAN